MSQTTKDLVGSSKRQKLGPDYFGYYTHEVVELLSRNEDVSPFDSKSFDLSQSRCAEVIGKDMIEHSNGTSGSLFSNSLGNELSDFTKERLKLLLRQGVKVLAPEVDEMLEPVVAMSLLKSQLESRKCLARGAACDVDAGKSILSKKLKRSSFSSSSLSTLSSPTNPESNREEREIELGSAMSAEKEDGEVDDDRQFLIENNSLLVEQTVKKYSDQYSTTLGHMEQRLEKILDTVMSKCRPMTIHEKHKLGKLIQKLPRENLDRVMEIIQNNNAAYTNSSDEVYVDLEKESNVTLWRLYRYVEAVENARKLAK